MSTWKFLSNSRAYPPSVDLLFLPADTTITRRVAATIEVVSSVVHRKEYCFRGIKNNNILPAPQQLTRAFIDTLESHLLPMSWHCAQRCWPPPNPHIRESPVGRAPNHIQKTDWNSLPNRSWAFFFRGKQNPTHGKKWTAAPAENHKCVGVKEGTLGNMG